MPLGGRCEHRKGRDRRARVEGGAAGRRAHGRNAQCARIAQDEAPPGGGCRSNISGSSSWRIKKTSTPRGGVLLTYFLKNAGGRAHTFESKGMHTRSRQRGAMRLAHPRWMVQRAMSLTVAARTHAARSSNSLRFACGVLRLKRRRQLIHRECGYRGIEVCVDWLADGSHEKKQGSRMRGLHARCVGQHQNHGGHCVPYPRVCDGRRDSRHASLRPLCAECVSCDVCAAVCCESALHALTGDGRLAPSRCLLGRHSRSVGKGLILF